MAGTKKSPGQGTGIVDFASISSGPLAGENRKICPSNMFGIPSS